MKKSYLAGMFLILCICVGLRMYKVTMPIADWHSFRQVDTAGVARSFMQFGFDIFRPRYHDLSNIQSGKDNPMGYRMVEFPLYQYIAARLAVLFPGITVEMWLRYVSIMAATGTCLFLMLLVAERMNPLTGLISGLVYAVLPFSMFYGRAILPDTFAVFWAIGSLYMFRIGVLPAALFAAVALLAKPTVGFLLIPSIYFFQPLGKRWIYFIMYCAIALLPLYYWRQWILHFPEGVPVSEWLLNSNFIRFKGSWFHWLFAQRIGNLILGYWGLILLGLGLLVKSDKKEGKLSLLFLLGSLLYLSIFATGNVQHDYYQIMIIPVISIVVAKGIYFLLTNTVFSKIASLSILTISVLGALGFSWFTIRSFYWINRPEILEAGQMADQLLPKDAKVIAPYNGDTTFLYYTHRQGWPLGFDIDQKIAMGATAYVTVSPSDDDFETKTLAQKYTVIIRNEKFAIIDLTKLHTP